MTKLLLASSSPYRRELMQRLGLPFSWTSPSMDEHPLAGENVKFLVERLAKQKAQTVAERHPEHIVVGSDQAASLNGQLLVKPGTFNNAAEQLRACSGQTVEFHTALCVLGPRKTQQSDIVTTTVVFRELTQTQVEHYIRREQPLDCAGSFKCEGLGITLFESINSEDPTALVGLPLIRLTSMLASVGVQPLGQ